MFSGFLKKKMKILLDFALPMLALVSQLVRPFNLAGECFCESTSVSDSSSSSELVSVHLIPNFTGLS